MQSTHFDAQHVISRYLAGTLPANESDEFERVLSERPELLVEVEQHLRFKEGLARLHERGELDALLREPSPRRWLPYAAAAALAILAFGGLNWLRVSSIAPVFLAHSLTEFATRGRESPAVVGSYTLARMRGESPGINVAIPPGPGAIELRILPSSLSTVVRYIVEIGGPGVSGIGAANGRIDVGFVGPDGYVTVYLNSKLLKPGQYEVRLLPSTATEPASEVDRFEIRVH